MDRKAHWQRVYQTKAPDAVSWYQEAPTVSAHCCKRLGLGPRPESSTSGAGIPASWISCSVKESGASACSTSQRRPPEAKERLGENARRVNWIEADVTGDWHVPLRRHLARSCRVSLPHEC